MIQAHAVDYIFADGTQALQGVTFGIERGSFVALVGRSGVGKSTLLRLIGNLLQPTGGTLQSSHAIDSVGIVFQNHNLMPWRTVTRNIRLPLEIRGERGAAAAQRVEALVRLVGLTGFADSYPAQLSGGMAQRVALARALVQRPELLLLDEPFGALDALTRERMAAELLRIYQVEPLTVCMVTHSITEAVLLADQVLVLGGTPGTLVAAIPILLPRPRTPEMAHWPEFRKSADLIRAWIDADGA
jgi:NitT/TauT family transport system ATP-binding protein